MIQNYILQYPKAVLPEEMALALPDWVEIRQGRGKYWLFPAIQPGADLPDPPVCLSIPSASLRPEDLSGLISQLGHLCWQNRYQGVPLSAWQRAEAAGAQQHQGVQQALAELRDYQQGLVPQGPRADLPEEALRPVT